MRLRPIDEQVVVVMGASSGIGRATALRFAARGAKLIVAARGEDGLASLVAEIRASGGDAVAVRAETADFSKVKEVADTAADVYGRIDTWVHAAGTSVIATFEETTPDEFRRVIEVNLLGQAYGAMAALPYLRRNGGGALIHVSSIEARVSMPYQSAYASSKHGIEGFMDALRVELAHEGVPISVTHVMPGQINTPFFDKVRTKLGVKPTVPHPIYDPDAVADAVLRAAEHPIRDVVIGGAGAHVMVAVQAVAPWLMDGLLARFAFGTQRSAETKGPGAPDSLYEPLAGFDTVHGSLPPPIRRTSAVAKLAMRPVARRAVAGVALGAAAVAIARLAGRSSRRDGVRRGGRR